MKSGMHIYRANRVESLLDLLTDVLGQPLDSPLASECVIVQSKGMATWLAMQLSGRFEVWANPDFPHPRQFIQRILRATLGEEGDGALMYSRERLAFVICALLDECRHDPDFSPLTSYLGDGLLSRKLQLAMQIAHLFDQYAVYRPEMVLAWEEGENLAFTQTLAEDIWQPKLWRRLVRHLGGCSPARLMLRARQSLAAGAVPYPHLLPARVSLFGINSLPAVYLGILGELAQILPVHFYLFSPAEGYFADICSQAEANRILTSLPSGLDETDLYLEVGHPLFASMGTMARDFQGLLENEISCFEALEQYTTHAAPLTMLEVLQDDILRLTHRCLTGDLLPLMLEGQDSSICIHACHSRLREIEVLQDQLLALLQDDPNLAPREIVIMFPEVQAYAPLIEAVFGLSSEDRRFIPFRIADRPLLNGAPLIEIFFRFLQMAPGRMTASEMLEFLACESIHLNFGITSADLPRIRLWVEKSGIRWGIDELHREAHQQPKDRQNTWRFGFDRLTLGYAVRMEGIFLDEILPYEEIEGQSAELAGRFIHFCETIFAEAEKLSLAMEISDWQRVIGDLLLTLFLEESSQAWQLQKIRDGLAQIILEAQDVGFTQTLDLKGLVILLKEKLSAPASAHGFLEGGLTFCGMLPMRSIPFKVICLLGMNDGAFPRVEHQQSFDLLARYPQRGDRAKRNDDRYLFLEALLAARRNFLVFYQGNTLRDGKELPPSVVIEELVDSLTDSFLLAVDSSVCEVSFSERRKKMMERLVTRHPLQPFSRRYFSGTETRLFSFAADYFRAAQVKQAGLNARQNFLLKALPSLPVPPAPVSMVDLSLYFSHPVRWFLENRLGLFLQEKKRSLQDREPIHLDALEKYQLGRELLTMQGKGILNPEIQLARWRREGLLPLGQGAQATFAELRETVCPIVEQLLKHGPGSGVEELPPLRREIVLSPEIVLHGELDGRYPEGRLYFTNSLLHGRILLAVWLEHLFLSALAPEDQRCETIVIGRGRDKGTAQVFRLSPVSDAATLLLDLASLFADGANAPLPFFPRSALAFARSIYSGKGSEEERRIAAFDRAEDEYRGNDFAPGEGEDPYCRQLFADNLPVSSGYAMYAADKSPAFAELAIRIFTPMLMRMEEL